MCAETSIQDPKYSLLASCEYYVHLGNVVIRMKPAAPKGDKSGKAEQGKAYRAWLHDLMDRLLASTASGLDADERELPVGVVGSIQQGRAPIFSTEVAGCR